MEREAEGKAHGFDCVGVWTVRAAVRRLGLYAAMWFNERWSGWKVAEEDPCGMEPLAFPCIESFFIVVSLSVFMAVVWSEEA